MGSIARGGGGYVQVLWGNVFVVIIILKVLLYEIGWQALYVPLSGPVGWQRSRLHLSDHQQRPYLLEVDGGASTR